MFGVNYINESIQWLGVPDPLKTDGPPWIDNILDTSPAWGAGGTATNLNWGSQPGGPYGSFSIPLSDPVRTMPACVFRIP